MAQGLFANSSIGSPRIIYTPSSFACSALIHLQETGRTLDSFDADDQTDALVISGDFIARNP